MLIFSDKFVLFFGLRLLFFLFWSVMQEDINYLSYLWGGTNSSHFRNSSDYVFFRRQDFCYDHMTSQPLQVCFLFIIHAISTEVHVWRHFSLFLERVFLFIRVIEFLVTRDLPHSQKWLPHFESDFYLFYFRYKVKRMCVTLNEVYLRAANRCSNNVYRLLIKI